MDSSGAKDIRLGGRGDRILSGVAIDWTVMRKVGGTRAAEMVTYRFLDRDDVTPEAIIETAVGRTAGTARGRAMASFRGLDEIMMANPLVTIYGNGPCSRNKLEAIAA